MSLVLKPLPKITRQILENISYAAKIWESSYTPLMNYKKKKLFHRRMRLLQKCRYKNLS